MQFSQPKQHTTKATAITKLNPKITELTLQIQEPFNFLAGQFVNLKVTDTRFRSYSIASNPRNTNEIKLVVASGHVGLGADYVNNISVGEDVVLIGPSGRFALPETLSNNLEFYATGTGLAPFIGMFYQLQNQGYNGKIKLYFGVRDQSDEFYIDLLQHFSDTLDLNIILCRSQSDNKRVTCGLVQDHPTNTQYFLCGNPGMVEDMISGLKDKDVSEQNIFHEKFTSSLS